MVCFICVYYTSKIERLKMYFSPKHFSGLFESTHGFSEGHGLLTMLSASLHVSKLFINEKLSLVFWFSSSYLLFYLGACIWIKLGE